MDMTKCRIVELHQDIAVYGVNVAHGDVFGVTADDVLGLSAGGKIELVAHQHITGGGVDVFPFQQGVEGFIIGEGAAVIPGAGYFFYHRGLYEGQQVEMYRAVAVSHSDLRDVFVLLSGRQADQVDFMPRKQMTEDINALGTVMIAGDEHDFSLRQYLTEPGDEFVKERNCLG